MVPVTTTAMPARTQEMALAALSGWQRPGS